MVSGSSDRKSVDGHGGAATTGITNKAKKKSSNPYSTRGLDKYSTLLSDLEARRTKIMEKAQGVSMVKFKYSDSDPDHLIPIVFRGRREQLDRKLEDGKSTTKQPMSRSEAPRFDSKNVKAEVLPPPPVAAGTAARRKRAEKRMDWTARYYWHLVVVVELFGLVVFGRAFAVCCMLMWWYLVPVVHGEQGGSLKLSTKGGARKVSNNNTRVNTGTSVGYHSTTNGVK
ncbi:uncharacterized protein LOC122009691 [Zingiber officinale]|uniref:ZCF37 n=1 Tax=Zingiber officinale TaxID=94328 RepID=A0A8J5FBX7_ZINOF|nr:uncharacterized protein LOC122009691 [Zingiber officinale]KAG6484569.1 hypothetical protein ZIOFF_053089 [Zingiber officinale]